MYERALGSSLDLENSNTLYLAFMSFIQDHLKDNTLVRAKYEQKLKHSKCMPARNKVELLIENGNYEEMQNNLPRARKIFE